MIKKFSKFNESKRGYMGPKRAIGFRYSEPKEECISDLYYPIEFQLDIVDEIKERLKCHEIADLDISLDENVLKFKFRSYGQKESKSITDEIRNNVEIITGQKPFEIIINGISVFKDKELIKDLINIVGLESSVRYNTTTTDFA